MKTLRLPAIFLILCLLTACARKIRADQPANLSGVLSGTISYRERIALPPDAKIIVSLEDVTRTDQGSSFIAQQVLHPTVQVPISFELRYLPQAIYRSHRYIVRAEIVDVNDALLWSSLASYPVLFNQPAKPIAIIVERPAISSANTTAKVVAIGRAVPFKCDDFAFVAKFTNDTAEVATPGRIISLPRVISGSGARYSDGQTTLWNKGLEAILEINGVQHTNCQAERLPSPK